MPSVDRVGRAFPLTLVSRAPVSVDITIAHTAATPIFEELELIALDALEEGVTPDFLSTRLDLLEPIIQKNIRPSTVSKSVSSIARPASIWSAALGGKMATMRCAALPNADEMEGIFDLNAAIWKTNDHHVRAQI